jgi:hypothetical protein
MVKISEAKCLVMERTEKQDKTPCRSVTQAKGYAFDLQLHDDRVSRRRLELI